jgi:transposase-like protein
MELRLLKNARTTPAVRAEIAASGEGVSALARRYNIGRVTARKWKNRTDTQDRSHTAHHLQTTMNRGQEAIAVYLRQHLKRRCKNYPECDDFPKCLFITEYPCNPASSR